ncbi:MAG: T9SS type A sorting domain-containing protein [Bacteroidota bacterium]
MKKIIQSILMVLMVVAILSPSSINAQKQNEHWTLGNSLWQFDPGATDGFNRSGTPNYRRYQNGTASDPTTGELLFYTDGLTVFDKNDNIMSNGTFLVGTPTPDTLLDHFYEVAGYCSGNESPQSTIILPKPGTTDRYYIITNVFTAFQNCEGGASYDEFYNFGVRYSEVNMSASGGLGSVVSKNNVLQSNGSGGMSATLSADETFYWLLLNDGGNFKNYKVESTGINTSSPVISPTGSTFASSRVIAPNGSKVVSGVSGEFAKAIFDFNTSTGVVNNRINLDAPDGFYEDFYGNNYGIAFSPDSNIVYFFIADAILNGNFDYNSGLAMYNISTQELVGFSATSSQPDYPFPNDHEGAGFQLADNGKIYFQFNDRVVPRVHNFENDYWGVIENPNVWDPSVNPITLINAPSKVLNGFAFPQLIPSPDPCNNCDNAEAAADAVFATLVEDPDCVTFTLSYPAEPLCADAYAITWNGASAVILDAPGESVTTEYTSEGLKNINIEVLRDGQGSCGDFDYSVEVDFRCNCDECGDVATSIINSVGPSPNLPGNCTKYRAVIPEIDDCFVGNINWGDGSPIEALVSGSIMTHQYTAGGTYPVTVILSEGALSICSVQSTDVEVTCPVECPNPCDIEADFIALGFDCTFNFNGENLANDCDSSIYDFSWVINGTTLASTEDFNYTFPGSGSYTVSYTIAYTDGFRRCEDTHTEVITVNCNSGPTDCGIPQCFDIVEAEPCTDFLGRYNCPSQNYIEVDWFYRICGVNGGDEVFIGSTSGTGTQNVPFSLPPGNNYDGCILILNAYVTDSNDDTCIQTTTLELDCPPVIGGGKKTSLFPNPTQSSFTVKSDSKISITEINVRSIYGELIITRQSNTDGEINLSGNHLGVYFVEVKFEDGTSEIKKLILEQ